MCPGWTLHGSISPWCPCRGHQRSAASMLQTECSNLSPANFSFRQSLRCRSSQLFDAMRYNKSPAGRFLSRGSSRLGLQPSSSNSRAMGVATVPAATLCLSGCTRAQSLQNRTRVCSACSMRRRYKKAELLLCSRSPFRLPVNDRTWSRSCRPSTSVGVMCW